MMRKIAIIGAGQSGLQLGIGLVSAGFKVTIFSDKTPADLLTGKVLSSQCMFNNALNTERKLKINYWESSVPHLYSSEITIIDPENLEKKIHWTASFTNSAYSVDQRFKNSLLMSDFQNIGGNLIIDKVNISDLESIAEDHELVIVATGRGGLSSAFRVNESESLFEMPQRALALTYVNNMKPQKSSVNFNVIPNIGEYITYPALTINGSCDIMIFEGIPGGPMDCWKKEFTSAQHLMTSLSILENLIPWEFERCKNVSLTDDRAFACDSLTPCVRDPILTLPSGKLILGMGDSVIVNDPITGQGANSAAKCADIYLSSILENPKRFDRDWMEKTFSVFWDYASHVVAWTNSFLSPMTPHIYSLLTNAQTDPTLASKIVNGFDDPRTVYPWWYGPD